jgi:antitoxin CptB
MLELDLLLLPFMDDKAFDALSSEQQLVFQRLLTSDDPDLYAWFMGHQSCEDDELKTMIGIILNRVKV